jgi:hypothetical protein
MIGFKEFLMETDGLEEGLLRSGAALAFAAQGKRYGDEAVRAYRTAQQSFVGYHRKSEGQKVDAIAAAIGHLLDGLIATRLQIGSISGQVTSK